MADLIERDALEPFYESGTDPNDTYADMTFIRAKHIENAPSVNCWIPCKERLPEDWQDVIIYISERWAGRPIQIAHIQHDSILWEMSDGEFYFSKDEVTHWMPMPEPPESEVQNG